jgi:hypothetical protein
MMAAPVELELAADELAKIELDANGTIALAPMVLDEE